MRAVILALFLISASAPVLAETVSIPGPCQTQKGFHDFDFWLGSWTVTDRVSGKLAGHNKIVADEGGCVLLESWSGARGSTGMSVNWFNPESGKWKQVWVSAMGNSIEIEGGLIKPGVMQLVGTISNYGDGTAPFRGTWTENDNGTVRQFFEQQDKDGVWQPWFDGIYSRHR